METSSIAFAHGYAHAAADPNAHHSLYQPSCDSSSLPNRFPTPPCAVGEMVTLSRAGLSRHVDKNVKFEHAKASFAHSHLSLDTFGQYCEYDTDISADQELEGVENLG